MILFGFMIFYQIKVEFYKSQLIKKYNFSYLKKHRLRYTPFIIFFIDSKFNKKNKCYFKNINLPYTVYEKENKIVRKDYEEYYIQYNVEFNAYLMYCYHDLDDLNCD